MKNGKILIFVCMVLLIGVIGVYAQNLPTVCCEKTVSGAWCQNTEETNCELSVDVETGNRFRKSPTSCESTSFCKLGCCVDTDEGLCMENTPQRVCQDGSGTWLPDNECNVVQCSLGCCVLGDQASFVTQTRCKKLSSQFGLETNFRTDITDEASCIAIAHFSETGACVFESSGSRTCLFLTRQECLQTTIQNATNSPEFFPEFLCSADELGTECGPTTETTCIDGLDEVYFKDSCGNRANVYDASKIYGNDPNYWQKVVNLGESCGIESSNGNAGSRSCGNCNYFRGSVCSSGEAQYGEYFCQDINCFDTTNGLDYKNGESWCVDQGSVGDGSDSVGSRHYRHVCISGEEIIEPCADFRNEFCVEGTVTTNDGNFNEAACRVNRWESCVDQDEEEDCLNTDRRDCYFEKGIKLIVPSGGDGGLRLSEETSPTKRGFTTGGSGACLPLIPPGLNHYDESDAPGICSIATSECIVKYEKRLIGSKKCVENCECLTGSWAGKINNACVAMGDCGAYVNVAGRYTTGGAEFKVNDGKRILEGLLDSIRSKAGV